MSGDDTRRPRPWYREFWPWALMLPPALSVAGGVTMVVLATSTPTALVVEDYSRIEEITSDRFERDRAAVALGVAADLEFEAVTHRVELAFVGPPGQELPLALVLRLRHASDTGADRELRLARYGDRYRGTGDWLAGSYHVELEPENRLWRLAAGPVTLDGPLSLRPQEP